MKSINIENIKKMAGALLAKDVFDSFLLVEAHIDVLISYDIDGHINKGFLEEDDQETASADDCIRWEKVRPFCYNIIKGSRLPLSMKFVFKISNEKITEFLKNSQIEDIKPETVKGLYMNIRYENGQMDCITGTSLSTFDVFDRRIEKAWDDAVEKFLTTYKL